MLTEVELFLVNTEENHSFLVNARTEADAERIVLMRDYTPTDIQVFSILPDESRDLENLLM